jgi:hypothetical protein
MPGHRVPGHLFGQQKTQVPGPGLYQLRSNKAQQRQGPAFVVVVVVLRFWNGFIKKFLALSLITEFFSAEQGMALSPRPHRAFQLAFCLFFRKTSRPSRY